MWEADQEHEHTPTNMPVWAPDPGVPIVARILSYTFAVLMALTIALSLTRQRPADTAPYPDTWATFHSQYGWSISYPAAWSVEKESRFFTDGEAVTLWPDSTMRVEFVTLTNIPAGEQDRVTALVHDAVQQKAQAFFPGYAERGTLQGSAPTDRWTLFSYTPKSRGAAKMAGGWLVRINGNRALIFIALSTQDGWSSIEFIINQMLQQLTW